MTCGFNAVIHTPERMDYELTYWRKQLSAALDMSRKAQRPYGDAEMLRDALKALEVYWLGDSRDKTGWNVVCDSAYRQITAFNQWVNRQ